MSIARKSVLFVAYSLSCAITLTAFMPLILNAQVLEEIIVTAQRREQSVQQVPLSLEVYSGADLQKQGFRVMDDLAAFSPSVEITTDVIRYNISIRGMGSNGPNLGLEQSAATFVDGIHFGRGSMSNGAYLDLERLEILRGPQPVFFGMNSTAGAFSLTTKKPGNEWEGDVTGEFGSLGRKNVEGGIGGPVTDTLGIRFAGKLGRYDGYLTDVVTHEKFPKRDDEAGRITLQWAPNDAFEATLSAAIQVVNTGGDGHTFCVPWRAPELTEFATFIPGMVPAWDAAHPDQLPLPDCERDGFTKLGRQAGDGTPETPVAGIRQSDQQAGFVDLTDLWPERFAETGVAGMFHMNAKNYRLGLIYDFGNDIAIEAITGYVDYFRQTFEDTSAAPIMANAASRTEIFDMISQEVRIRSTAAGTFEWELGAYYQTEDLDGDPSCESRPGLRHPIRCNYLWQDSEWKNVFSNVTFNFMGEKASIDVGARYSMVDKEASIYGTAQTLIFNINPDPDGDGIVRASTGQNITPAIINCATGHRQCGTFGAGFWTHIWGEDAASGGSRRTPDVWHLRKPVAFGPELQGVRKNEAEGANGFRDTYETDSLDPQVVFRYRPNEDMSLYAKWAQAFKSGGFDTASRALPDSPDRFTFGDEDATVFEVGIKGSLLENSVRYGVSVFRQRITGLQQETRDPEGGSDITQAGLQETKGIEFDTTWAATDRLTATLVGAIMKGTLISFPNAGCTDIEFANAADNLCTSLAESIAQFGNNSRSGFIDRSGYPSPRTPDWKFSTILDYWFPLTDSMKGVFNTNIGYSDGYIHDVEGYSSVVKWGKHVDWNLNAGVAEIDDTWRVGIYARNILNASVKYFRENDVTGGIELVDFKMSPSQYFTYGVQLVYNYN